MRTAISHVSDRKHCIRGDLLLQLQAPAIDCRRTTERWLDIAAVDGRSVVDARIQIRRLGVSRKAVINVESRSKSVCADRVWTYGVTLYHRAAEVAVLQGPV